MRLRVRASWKDCCTAGGAPSPTWQQGAITITLSLGLAMPSLAAVMAAAPPPTAFTVAAPLAVTVMVRTRLLVVLQDTGRSVSASPPEPMGWAVRFRVCPRLRVSVEATDAPLSCTRDTGGRITGPVPPG